ncbi:TorF family putative porin [Asticcacaulis sp.]|uniref:TorF family putative porin n=1 Tax=Asticcacaulis sp. TaxID=1872648 RepID=UPI002BCBC632|nr:TorF family putative porin [Asticcacaulis sp.]HTM81387.1 TorF family putative porin [Asticcacaulis sp.]
MRKSLPFLVVGASALFAVSAHAEDKPFFDISGEITVATDGMSKDTSETGNDPQGTAYIQAAHGPFFAGIKVKNITNSDGADSQQEYVLGVKGKKAGFQLGLQAAYKIKVGAKHSQNEYVEWKGNVSRAFGNTTAKVEIEYSADSSGNTEEAIWVDASLSQKLNAKWSVSGGIGARRLTPAKDYNGVNLGVTYALLPATSLDLRYYDTDRHEYGEKNKPHLVLKLAQKF